MEEASSSATMTGGVSSTAATIGLPFAPFAVPVLSDEFAGITVFGDKHRPLFIFRFHKNLNQIVGGGWPGFQRLLIE